MNADLRLSRAERRGPWPLILGCAFAVAFFGYLGPSEQADAIALEADLKLLRVQIARRVPPHVTPAVIGGNMRPVLLDEAIQPAALADCDRIKLGAAMTINMRHDGVPLLRQICLYPKE